MTAALPPGTRRLTADEERWLAESGRWSTTHIGPRSAWVTEPELRVIRLPGRELWMTAAEWDGLKAMFKAMPDEPQSPWIPADPDGLPPEAYPFWRRQEQAKRQEAT